MSRYLRKPGGGDGPATERLMFGSTAEGDEAQRGQTGHQLSQAGKVQVNILAPLSEDEYYWAPIWMLRETVDNRPAWRPVSNGHDAKWKDLGLLFRGEA